MTLFAWKVWRIPARNRWRRWGATSRGSRAWRTWVTRATWTRSCRASAACRRSSTISSRESTKQPCTSKFVYSCYLDFSAWRCFPSKEHVLSWGCPGQPPMSSPPCSYIRTGHKLLPSPSSETLSPCWVTLALNSLCHFGGNSSVIAVSMTILSIFYCLQS